MPAVFLPAPATWGTPEQVKAPALRADVSGTIQLLSRPPLFIGSQTTTAQSVANNTDTIASLDTDVYDNLNGHLTNTNAGRYYGMFPGLYLCESNAPLNYTGGAGAFSCGFTASQGGVLTTRMGMRAPNTSGNITACTAAKLLQMTNTGTYGGASNDYITLAVYQNSAGSANLLNGTARFPSLSCLWVAASSGTAGLPVPACPVWPANPADITAAWLNANVRDAVNFLIYPPVMEAQYLTTGANLASQATVPAVGNTISLNSETVDNYSAYSSPTWTAPVAGCYYAYGQVACSMAGTSVALGAGLTVTSANYNGGTQVTLWGGTITASTISLPNCAVVRRGRLRLNAGDTVKLAGFQRDSGSNAAALLGTGDYVCRLILVWRSS